MYGILIQEFNDNDLLNAANVPIYVPNFINKEEALFNISKFNFF